MCKYSYSSEYQFNIGGDRTVTSVNSLKNSMTLGQLSVSIENNSSVTNQNVFVESVEKSDKDITITLHLQLHYISTVPLAVKWKVNSIPKLPL